jgi:hypothetical protein
MICVVKKIIHHVRGLSRQAQQHTLAYYTLLYQQEYQQHIIGIHNLTLDETSNLTTIKRRHYQAIQDSVVYP